MKSDDEEAEHSLDREYNISQLISLLCMKYKSPNAADNDLYKYLDLVYDALLELESENSASENQTQHLKEFVSQAIPSACTQLNDDGYPDLANRLVHLHHQLSQRCNSFLILGTPTEDISGKPITAPLSDPTSILVFLLKLKGSMPSIRHRQTTFQINEIVTPRNADFTALNDTSITPNNTHNTNTKDTRDDDDIHDIRTDIHYSTAHVYTRLFAEAPDPTALFDASTTKVLLPEEAVYTISSTRVLNPTSNTTPHINNNTHNTSTSSASINTSDLRPSWQPTDITSLPTLRGSGWLDIPHRLQNKVPVPVHSTADSPTSDSVALNSSTSTAAVHDSPLKIPLNTLAMDDSPGESTAFNANYVSPVKKPGDGFGVNKYGGVGDGNNGVKGALPLSMNLTVDGRKNNNNDDKGIFDPHSHKDLNAWWSLEESQLASDAVLALQGVHSARWRLRGALRASHALARPAIAGLLKKVEHAAGSRQYVQRFIDDTIKKQDRSRRNKTSTCQEDDADDPIIYAFAVALNDILRIMTYQLSLLLLGRENDDATSSTLISLTQVVLKSGPLQHQFNNIAQLLKGLEKSCQKSDTDNTLDGDGDILKKEGMKMNGISLLEQLYLSETTAQGLYCTTLQYLFASALRPYLSFCRQWVFSPTLLTQAMPYTTFASPYDLQVFPLSCGNRPTTMIKKKGSSNNSNSNTNMLGVNSGSFANIIIPSALPCFLSHIEDEFISAGNQLRFLHSIHNYGASQLASQLALAFSLSSSSSSLAMLSKNALNAIHTMNTTTHTNKDNIANINNNNGFNDNIINNNMMLLDGNGGNTLEDPELILSAHSMHALHSFYDKLESHVRDIINTWTRSSSSVLSHHDVKETHRDSVVAETTTTITPSPLYIDYDSNNNTNTTSNDLLPVPLASSFDAFITRPLKIQYNALQTASLHLITNVFHLSSHLSFMRDVFFLHVGDFADAFLSPLIEKISTLEPLNTHIVQSALFNAIRNSSLNASFQPSTSPHLSEKMHFLDALDIDLMSGKTATSNFLLTHTSTNTTTNTLSSSLSRRENANNNKRAQLPRQKSISPVFIAPSRVDALDCILLCYNFEYPLSSFFPEDVTVAYSALFNALLRVRRVSLLLHKVSEPLTRHHHRASPRVDSISLMRLKQLHVFMYSAGHFVAHIQNYQGQCGYGDHCDVLKKLVKSDEQSGVCLCDEGEHEATTFAQNIDLNNNNKATLQDILDAHRVYINTTTFNILTLHGHYPAQQALDASLGALLDLLVKIETMCGSSSDVGFDQRSLANGAWAVKLREDNVWKQILDDIHAFNAAKLQLQHVLKDTGDSGGPLGYLLTMLS